MAQILLKHTNPHFLFDTRTRTTHSKGFWGPVERHVSSPLSAVFAVRQARGALHLQKRVSDTGRWEKGGVPCGKAKALSGEKRATTKQLSSRERETETDIEREREKEEGEAVGTMPLQLQVQWLRPCVYECVCREHFLFCVN